MPLPKIKSIEIGWGSNSTFFEVNPIRNNPITKIEEAIKPIGSKEILVYRVYKGENLFYEQEANSAIGIMFFEPEIETDET